MYHCIINWFFAFLVVLNFLFLGQFISFLEFVKVRNFFTFFFGTKLSCKCLILMLNSEISIILSNLLFLLHNNVNLYKIMHFNIVCLKAFFTHYFFWDYIGEHRLSSQKGISSSVAPSFFNSMLFF